jgi:tetratricopeptide (TPR) repeat protein
MRGLGLIVGMCAIAVVLGCGGNGDGGGGVGGGGDTAASLTAEAWDLFEAGQYGDALAKFGEALGLDDTYADAHNGRGWTYAKMDSLASALDEFQLAITHGLATADPYAGRVPVYRDYEGDANHFSHAITSGESALGIAPRYEFGHDDTFDWKDLMVILAHCCCAEGDFETANAWVDSLPDGVPLDPESPTFEEDLLDHIEDLTELYGGS